MGMVSLQVSFFPSESSVKVLRLCPGQAVEMVLLFVSLAKNTNNGLQQYKMFHSLSGPTRKKQQDF